jgi:hypothetical protein
MAKGEMSCFVNTLLTTGCDYLADKMPKISWFLAAGKIS